MANIFLNIPVVVGVGAPVNIAAMGADKTIVVSAPFSGALTLEISEDAGATWCQLYTFTGTGKKVLSFAADRIRARSSSGNATVNIGANDDGGLFVVIPAPLANGIGVPIDISALGNFTTVVVQGDFGGGVIGIQISEDGVNFAEFATFADPGCVSKMMVGDFVRAVSRGAGAAGVPFAPKCAMGAINDDNADLLAVQEEGVLVGSRPIMNFIGAAVTAVDNPGQDRIDVTITAAALTNAAPTQIDVGDAGAVGVGTLAARDDHQHALPAPAAPANVTKAAASAGAATTVARADHKHDVTTAAAGTIAVGDTAAEGTATSLARSDHRHALPNQLTQGISTTPSALTWGANVALNALLSNQYTLLLAGATAQISNPTNIAAGQSFLIAVTQGAGAQAVTFDTFYSFGAEGAPDLTTSGAGIVDIISCVVVTATKIACTTLRGY